MNDTREKQTVKIPYSNLSGSIITREKEIVKDEVAPIDLYDLMPFSERFQKLLKGGIKRSDFIVTAAGLTKPCPKHLTNLLDGTMIPAMDFVIRPPVHLGDIYSSVRRICMENQNNKVILFNTEADSDTLKNLISKMKSRLEIDFEGDTMIFPQKSTSSELQMSITQPKHRGQGFEKSKLGKKTVYKLSPLLGSLIGPIVEEKKHDPEN